MNKVQKDSLVRITTVPLSLDKLLEGQLNFMSQHYEVTAIASEEKYLKKIAKREGVGYYTLPLTRKITPIQDIKSIFLLYRFLKKKKPYIVHTHTPKAGLVGMFAAYFARVPHRLHTVAGLPLMETKGFKRWVLNTVEKLIYKAATGIYPNSLGLKSFILQQKFVPERKVKVLGMGSSNGVDTDFFNPEKYSQKTSEKLKEELEIPKTDFIFLFVGRLVSDKGVNELVDAFIKVNEKYGDITLLLVGPQEAELDPLKPSVLEHIKNHPKILSVGYKDDVRPYYAFAKALVFPSYREGFPNVVLQAAAMGLPCIATDINGCNEIIQNEKNGLLIPPKDKKALEVAMMSLAENKALTRELGNNTRAGIVQNYKRQRFWEIMLAEYKNLAIYS